MRPREAIVCAQGEDGFQNTETFVASSKNRFQLFCKQNIYKKCYSTELSMFSKKIK